MAFVTAIGELPLDLSSYNIAPIAEAIASGRIVTTPTSAILTTQANERVTLTGEFIFAVVPPSINSKVTTYQDNAIQLTFLNIQYGVLAAAIQSGDGINFLRTLLSGRDSLWGGNLGDTLFGYGDNDTIYGEGGNDLIAGGLGQDFIGGGSGRDTINGGQGRDTLGGDEGADVITGGLGGDLISGGLGRDTLTGDDGPDTFSWRDPNSGLDTLTDFTPSEDTIEIIAIPGYGFSGFLASGVLATDAFVLGDAAIDTSDRFIYNPSTGALLFDADGTGSIAAIQIATLSNNAALTANNIVIRRPTLGPPIG